MEKEYFHDRSEEANYYDSIHKGDVVLICEKHMQKIAHKKEDLTEGVVLKKLTNKKFHPRGIKVMLEDGKIGRVVYLLNKTSCSENIKKKGEKETLEERINRLENTYFK